MIAIYIILIILAVFLILISVPARCTVVVNTDEAHIFVKYLFIKYIVYPREKKKEEKKSLNSNSDNSMKTKKQIPWETFLNSDVLVQAKNILSYIIKHAITIETLNIRSKFGTGDPASTGMLCGGAYAAIYGIIGKIKASMKLKEQNVELEPDFDNATFNAGVYIRFHTRIAHMFVIVTMILKLIIILKKQKKKG